MYIAEWPVVAPRLSFTSLTNSFRAHNKDLVLTLSILRRETAYIEGAALPHLSGVAFEPEMKIALERERRKTGHKSPKPGLDQKC